MMGALKVESKLFKELSEIFEDSKSEITLQIFKKSLELAQSYDKTEVLFVLFCKLRSNGMPVPLLRNCYSIFNGTKYR